MHVGLWEPCFFVAWSGLHAHFAVWRWVFVGAIHPLTAATSTSSRLMSAIISLMSLF